MCDILYYFMLLFALLSTFLYKIMVFEVHILLFFWWIALLFLGLLKHISFINKVRNYKPRRPMPKRNYKVR